MSVSNNTVLKQKHTTVRFIKQQNHLCSTMVLKSYFITPPLSIKVTAETFCLHESPNPVQENYLVVFHTHPQKSKHDKVLRLPVSTYGNLKGFIHCFYISQKELYVYQEML